MVPSAEGQEEEEDWEAEAIITTSYNPAAKINYSAGDLLHNPIGSNKSEQRRFRQNQRLAKSGGGFEDEDESWSSKSSSRSSLDRKSPFREIEPAEVDAGRPESPLASYPGQGFGRGRPDYALKSLPRDLAAGLPDNCSQSVGRGSPNSGRLGRGTGRGRGGNSSGEPLRRPGRGRASVTSGSSSMPRISSASEPPPGFGPLPPAPESVWGQKAPSSSDNGDKFLDDFPSL